MAWLDLVVPRLRRPCHYRCVAGWYMGLLRLCAYGVAGWANHQCTRLQREHRVINAVQETVYPWWRVPSRASMPMSRWRAGLRR